MVLFSPCARVVLFVFLHKFQKTQFFPFARRASGEGGGGSDDDPERMSTASVMELRIQGPLLRKQIICILFNRFFN